MDNCWLLRNGEYGIRCEDSTPQLRNSIVSESDLKEAGRAGIRLYHPTSSPVLHNLTIANNKAEGIFFADTGTPDLPDIKNCIVYFNNNSGLQLVGLVADEVAYYSCIQDCNEVNNNHNDEPGFAYSIDPNGMPDPNNYHLASNAFCIEKGDPNFSDSSFDYDGDYRVMGTIVDIGADEVNPDCNDVHNYLDWNADGIVNLKEFSTIQRAWLNHDPDEAGSGEPNEYWNPICDLDPNGTSEYVIDLADLDVFCDHWLWIACWKEAEIEEMMMSGGGESMTMSLESFSIESTTQTAVIETEPNYADMPESELALFVKAIYEIVDYIDWSIEENHENAENLIEAKEFLEDVLSDIKASRQ